MAVVDRYFGTTAKFSEIAATLSRYFKGEETTLRPTFELAENADDLYFIAIRAIIDVFWGGPGQTKKTNQTWEMSQKFVNVFAKLKRKGFSLDHEPPGDTIQAQMGRPTFGVVETVAYWLNHWSQTLPPSYLQVKAIRFIKKMFSQVAIKSARKEGTYSDASIASALIQARGDPVTAAELLETIHS